MLSGMRTQIFVPVLSGFAAVALAGCDGSKSTSGSVENAQPVMPQTQTAVNTAAEETKKALSDAASTAAQNAKATVSEITSKFVAMAKQQGDSILSSIGQDLSAKAKSLVDASGGNATIKTNVESSLTAMLNGNDTSALAPAFQLPQTIGLTPNQMQLAKEVGNLASAFVVQRNFSALSGAQGDVATLVKALRDGQYAATLPPLKNIMNNASLTPAQKEIVGSIADKYAPELKQAADTLQKGLQGLQGLPGINKK